MTFWAAVPGGDKFLPGRVGGLDWGCLDGVSLDWVGQGWVGLGLGCIWVVLD